MVSQARSVRGAWRRIGTERSIVEGASGSRGALFLARAHDVAKSGSLVKLLKLVKL